MPAASDPVRFSDIRPTTPDLDRLGAQAQELCDALARETSARACVDLLHDWEGARRRVGSYDAMVDLAFSQNTLDEGRKAVREAWDEVSPRWTELQVKVKRALLSHPDREALEAELGAQAFALWESEVLTFDPTIKSDLVKESSLKAEYTELLAKAELEFRGEALNLSTIGKYRVSADREVRHDAESVLWGWFEANGTQLDRVFDDLVRVRTKMATDLGFVDYVGMGYKRMCRVDYELGDVERFREEVRTQVVPLATKLVERQARELGVNPIMAWDEYVHDLRGNPAPKGNRAWMVERAQEMFDDMGPRLGGFFRRMQDGGFLDLDSRKGKAGGGFCTAFPTHGMPFVYANFNGTKGDVEVLTHEIGHAFQCYESRDQWPSDYLWPTLESCEVHSMSLEFLTWPYMEAFFREDADRFRRTHLTESILFLPYGTAVDHFQHELYENPEATPAERHAMWRRMEQTYLPWRDWGDLSHPSKGGRWQHQRHIYLDPFYYIDYVLAQTCALQFWARAEVDRKAAMKDYVALCERGGSAPFQELVRSAGLTSPFEAGCLGDVVARASETLEL